MVGRPWGLGLWFPSLTKTQFPYLNMIWKFQKQCNVPGRCQRHRCSKNSYPLAIIILITSH